jgi:acyl-CoA synthetase (AMP-forming)/AMP-acid ligase II
MHAAYRVVQKSIMFRRADWGMSGAMNLYSLLATSALRYAGRGAVYHGMDCVLTYGALDDRARRLGAAIARACPPGSRVVILSENCPAYVELLFGIWAAGAGAVPLNAKLHPREVAQILEDAEPALAFVSPGLADGLRGAACPVVEIGSPVYAAMLDEAPCTPADVEPDALAWLFYTSGTTGRSKGAMLSHANLQAMQIAHFADFEDVAPEHSVIHAAPMSHGSGLFILPYVARGARQVVPADPHSEPSQVLDLCDPGCGMFLAPTMVRRLRLAAEAAGRTPGNLRSIVYGGGPMHLAEIRASLATFGQVFTQLYGQGEAPMTITGLRRADHEGDDARLLSSVGWPRSGVEARIAGPDGEELPLGETGEILCRGTVVMQGYWRNEAATAATIRDGWLWTGDMGSMDADGLITLRDRSKDVIISGGSNIYPREVEEVLLAHPAVAEVSVVGAPDPDWGEIVIAFLVAAPGAAPDRDTLDAFCLERLARFKRPKSYVVLEALPKNAYGKVLKRELAASLR